MNRALLFTILSGLSLSCTNYTDNISMTAEHPVLPILTMKEANPVFKIELIRHQTGDNYSLQKLEVDLHGTTDIDDIESVGLYHTDSKGMIDTNKPVLQTVSASEKVVFNTDLIVNNEFGIGEPGTEPSADTLSGSGDTASGRAEVVRRRRDFEAPENPPPRGGRPEGETCGKKKSNWLRTRRISEAERPSAVTAVGGSPDRAMACFHAE